MIQEVKDELALLKKTDDFVDLNKKMTEWENFYKFHRPHGAFDGKMPYEALSLMLKNPVNFSNRV